MNSVLGPVYSRETHRSYLAYRYQQYTDKHLRNARRFTQGLAGEEAALCLEEIRKEMRRRWGL